MFNYLQKPATKFNSSGVVGKLPPTDH